MQDKPAELSFFNRFASRGEYNVFDDETNQRIIDTCLELAKFPAGAVVADLGCGSGIFTRLLQARRLHSIGLDLSLNLLQRGRQLYADQALVEGDVEDLPFASASLDGIVLSGLIHHLPDKRRLASEVYRVLKTGGSFAAFDPNRRNPFMWLYRDKSSPFYSSQGVTANERPVLAEELVEVFSEAGLKANLCYLSGLHYQYVASSLMRLALPVYNFLDDLLSRPKLMKSYRAFVFTSGTKL
jgi:ubiquinone/menaquinone biosynthesis C-methylase UbiE